MDTAELTAVAEQARAQFLAGRRIDLNDIVRVEGAMARAIKALGLPAVGSESANQPIFIISAADAKL